MTPAEPFSIVLCLVRGFPRYWFPHPHQGMCDMLQSQMVGDHTSVNLRRLVDCISRQAAAASASASASSTSCPCEPTIVDHRAAVPKTSDLLLRQIFTCKTPTGETQSRPFTTFNPAVTSCAANRSQTTRTYPIQSRIETICQTNQRPAASVRTAALRQQAAAVQIYRAHERPVATPPCPPLPPAPQPGVPRARCRLTSALQ